MGRWGVRVNREVSVGEVGVRRRLRGQKMGL